MCHHLLIYDGRDKNTNLQINASINIYQTHIDVRYKMKIIANR